VTTEYTTAEQAAVAAGVTIEEPVFEDYFGFEESKVWYFPDKKQYITFKIMNEGDKAKFQKETNRDITLKRNTGDASIKTDPAQERHILLETCVTGWSVYRKNAQGKFDPVPFSIGSPGSTFKQWLLKADPRLVEDLEFEIRKANPWLQGDMSVEDIDKEIERLVELREAAVKREEGKGAS
jgi:hypothetical protein